MAITYTGVRNPVWTNPEHTQIDLEVNFDHWTEDEYILFTADPNDVGEPHSVELYNRAVAGDFGPVSEFVPPADITGDNAMALLRVERDRLLEESDWMVLPDRTATAEQLAYRQALRDLPSDYPSAYMTWDQTTRDYVWSNVTWPSL